MLDVTLDRTSAVPIYRQIARQIREAVATGDLAVEDRLPTSRALAAALGVNRLTVTRAYQELTRTGVVASRVGRGTWVRDGASAPGVVDAGGPPDRGSVPAMTAGPDALPWASILSRARTRRAEPAHRPVPGVSSDDAISFAWLFPDPALYPMDAFRRAMQAVLKRDGRSVLGYGPPGGYPPLRALIARQMRQRGMEVAEEEIIVTNGSQQALDLLARALIDPGDQVCVEDPTYLGAVEVFQSYGADLSGIPMDEEGAVIGWVEAACDRRRTKLAYLMPDFQNPTSRTLSRGRREDLVALAGRRRLVLIEDDFDSEIRFEGDPLPTLKSLDRSGCVAYVSTFGKKLLPGLRVGWLAAPPPLAERCLRLKRISDYSTSVLLQAAVHEFCLRGSMRRHLANVVAAYGERRDAMLEAMSACFPPGVSWTRPEGGLTVWVTLPVGVDADGVAADAEARSVLVGRGDLFYLGAAPRGHLRLAFSQASPAQIRKGIEILGEVIRKRIAARPRSAAAEVPPLPII